MNPSEISLGPDVRLNESLILVRAQSFENRDDEVHLLPAPVFRMTAEIQARRRLGLTATLVREDGREDDVFSLIGPKKYDVPWRELEDRGWIAEATCTEIRVAFPKSTERDERMEAPAPSRRSPSCAHLPRTGRGPGAGSQRMEHVGLDRVLLALDLQGGEPLEHRTGR